MACGGAVSGERVMSGDTLGVEEARSYGVWGVRRVWAACLRGESGDGYKKSYYLTALPRYPPARLH